MALSMLRRMPVTVTVWSCAHTGRPVQSTAAAVATGVNRLRALEAPWRGFVFFMGVS